MVLNKDLTAAKNYRNKKISINPPRRSNTNAKIIEDNGT
jgi:hypothetical protein